MTTRQSRQHILRLLRDEFPLERLMSLVTVYHSCYSPEKDSAERQKIRGEVENASPERAQLLRTIRRIEEEHPEKNKGAYKIHGGNGHTPSIGYFLAGICLARGVNPEIYKNR